MGFKAAKFKSTPINTTWEYNGESLNLTIDADLMSRDFLKEVEGIVVQAAVANDGSVAQALANIDFMAETLARVILNWDVEDGDGQPIAVSVEFLGSLPAPALTQLYEFVLKANAPKAPTAAISGAGSSLAER